MPLAESLTVEITADSSSLEAELNRVASLVDGLSSQFGAVGAAAGEAAGGVSRLGRATAPLTRLSTLLGRIAGQLRLIGRIPVTVNTSAATASLAALSRQIATVRSQLASLNGAGGMPGGLSGGGAVRGLPTRADGGGQNANPRGYATGGLVNGPAGLDRVPAMLTAGEFVLNPRAVSNLGRPTLERLNAGLPLLIESPDPTAGERRRAVDPIRHELSEPSERPPQRSVMRNDGGKIEPPTPVVDVSVIPLDPPRRSEPPRPAAMATPPRIEPPRPQAMPAAPVFNEITVQVTQQVDLEGLLRDLELGRTTALDRMA